MTQIEKHEKAIKVLLAIQECDNRIASHQKYKKWKWYKERIEINTKIKSRLENYYNNNFKI
jgi:hypothetical protein